jgi:hypothetical protein
MLVREHLRGFLDATAKLVADVKSRIKRIDGTNCTTQVKRWAGLTKVKQLTMIL